VKYLGYTVSRKPFGIGHMYIDGFFFLRVTCSVTSQNIDLSCWDTLVLCANLSAARFYDLLSIVEVLRLIY
jgi:hypothetical protein